MLMHMEQRTTGLENGIWTQPDRWGMKRCTMCRAWNNSPSAICIVSISQPLFFRALTTRLNYTVSYLGKHFDSIAQYLDSGIYFTVAPQKLGVALSLKRENKGTELIQSADTTSSVHSEARLDENKTKKPHTHKKSLSSQLTWHRGKTKVQSLSSRLTHHGKTKVQSSSSRLTQHHVKTKVQSSSSRLTHHVKTKVQSLSSRLTQHHVKTKVQSLSSRLTQHHHLLQQWSPKLLLPHQAKHPLIDNHWSSNINIIITVIFTHSSSMNIHHHHCHLIITRYSLIYHHQSLSVKCYAVSP